MKSSIPHRYNRHLFENAVRYPYYKFAHLDSGNIDGRGEIQARLPATHCSVDSYEIVRRPSPTLQCSQLPIVSIDRVLCWKAQSYCICHRKSMKFYTIPRKSIEILKLAGNVCTKLYFTHCVTKNERKYIFDFFFLECRLLTKVHHPTIQPS